MANTHSDLDNLFTNIANAIRLKTDRTEKIIADTFPTEIRNLKTGFDYINHNVTEIKDYQFKNCTDLKNVDCYNLTSIGANAFEGCSSLETVVLYDNVISIGENAFKDCSKDLVIYCMFDSQPETWNANWNPDNCEVVFVQPIKTWDISATKEDNVIAKLYNDITEGYYRLIISGSGDMIDFNSSSTASWSSYIDNIRSIVFIGDITSIGTYAFHKCTSLTSIDIPDSVTSIGTQAFHKCTSLTSIDIPDSVTSIGNNAFFSCDSLTSITIPDSVTNIGQSAFSYTAYYNNSSNWENNVLYIDNALIKAKTSISGDYTIKDGTTVIANSAFYDCTSLTSITIPDSVTSIGSSAFYGCTALTSVTIGNSVTSIGNNAFYNCTSLVYNEYDNAYYLGNENNPYVVFIKVKNKNITSCDIYGSTKFIHSTAFSNCTSLESIEIPNSVTSIDNDTFFGCASLTSVTVPDSITNINFQAFYNCNKLASINYTGTVAQWNSIKFNTEWNYNTGNYTIYCTDGTITKSGTVTYYSTQGGDN